VDTIASLWRVDFRTVTAVRAALEMIEMVALLNVDRRSQDQPEIRIGIATGEMVAGYRAGRRVPAHAMG
jgi:class 3 adenylate cyclase